MAVLTATQKDHLRQRTERLIDFTRQKPVIDAAFQAIEDYFENTARAGFSAAINAATGGPNLSLAIKTAMVAVYLDAKAAREGVD